MPIYDLSKLASVSISNAANGQIVDRASDVDITATKGNLFDTNPLVKGFSIANDGDNVCFFRFGGDPGSPDPTQQVSAANYDVKLEANQVYESPFPYSGNVQGFAPNGDTTVRYVRWS